MKLNKTYVMSFGLCSTLMFTSCETVQNTNNQQRGTAIGVGAGAVLGGILGNNVGKGGNAPAGAVLGGIIGGIAGNVIGNRMDKQAREIKETLPGAEVERVNEGIKVTLSERMVNFAFDSDTLNEESRQNLDKLAQVLKNNPDTNINIYGHTDSKGSADYNMKLSQRRANAVRDYLLQHNIATYRMFPQGVGETEPRDTNETELGRANNRRVEFAITANENMIREASQAR